MQFVLCNVIYQSWRSLIALFNDCDLEKISVKSDSQII